MGGVLGEGGRVLGGGGADSQVRPKEDLQVNTRDFHELLVIMEGQTVKYGLKKTYRWISETFMSSSTLWMGRQTSTASRRPTGDYQRLSWVLGQFGWADSHVRSQEDLQVNIRDFHEFLVIVDGQTVMYCRSEKDPQANIREFIKSCVSILLFVVSRVFAIRVYSFLVTGLRLRSNDL